MFSGHARTSSTTSLYKKLVFGTSALPTLKQVANIRPRILSGSFNYVPLVCTRRAPTVHFSVPSPFLSSTSTLRTMATRRLHSTHNGQNGSQKESSVKPAHDHDHEHNHDEETHTHTHSIFSAHTHSRDDGVSGQGAETIVHALRGGGDRGSRITLLGLVINVGLTASKGAAAWYMNSAALLAEAGHSASDLLGDFVTLLCWNLSRKPPSERYPYGFGKFETIGTTMVSVILIGGAFGIGLHSYNLLLHHLVETASTLPAGPAQTILQNVTHVAQSVTGVAASIDVHHGHGHVLDPNAAWFAGASVLIKEWLYRVTKKVADDESSSVLLANAIHHRSDAYSSFVALIAILGTWWFPTLPLDQIGGIIVSIVILRQGLSLLGGAFGELTDASVSPKTHHALARALTPMLAASSSPSSQLNMLSVHKLRAMRSGALMFVDLTVEVPSALTVRDASDLEGKIRETLTKARKEIAEVRVKFKPANGGEEEVLR